MKRTRSGFLFFVVFTVSLASLQSSNKGVHDCQYNLKCSIEKTAKVKAEKDALTIAAYICAFTDAHEKYFKNHKIEPKIKCQKCKTKTLSLVEFEIGLIETTLKDLGFGKDNLENTKLIFEGYLKVVSQGSCSDILNYMTRIANETKQLCYGCGYPSVSWGK